MNKGLMVGGACGVVVVIGVVVYYSAVQDAAARRREAETDARIKSLEEQVRQQGTGVAVTPVIGAAAGTESFTQKQVQIRQVIEEGFKLLNTRDPRKVADAVRVFQEGIDKVDGENAQFHNGLGRSLLVLGKYAEALTAFEKGENLDPRLSDAISGQGWVYWNMKNYPSAKEKWEQALGVNPKSIDAWSAMAWIYLGLGERDKSLQGFNFLIFDTGMEREDWKIGRNMAAARNTDTKQISRYFPMPEAGAFTRAATGSAPATTAR